jgi:calcium-dependent protein kinase
VITYMLLSGTPPFYAKNGKNTLNSVKIGAFEFDGVFGDVSEEAKDLISWCLTKRVASRPNAKQALEHEWFKTLALPVGERRLTGTSIAVRQRFESFVKHSSLAHIIKDVVAHTLLPEQIADLRDLFTKLDVNNTGDISVADLRSVLLKTPGFREEDVKTIFTHIDIDQKGTIGYHEFIAATFTRQHVKEQNLQIAFERMSNRTEFITADDIRDLLGNTNHNIGEIMTEAGLTLDSKINFVEVSCLLVLFIGVIVVFIHVYALYVFR